jgi:phosphate transport system permease protein
VKPGRSSSMYRERLGRRRLAGWIFAASSFLATLTGVVVLVVLLGAVVAKALALPPETPWYRIDLAASELFSFLGRIATQYSSTKPGRAGFLAGIVGTLWLMGLVAVLAIPIGVGAAVYLEEIAKPGRLKRVIQTNLANLAGVPSIVYGILGLVVFSRAFGLKPVDQRSLLIDGALTLSLLILPVVVIATQEALRAVPPSLRQAALALGATRWQMLRDHVLPSAFPGILTGTILALSRAIGETAPLLMVGAASSLFFLPDGPFDRYSALPVQIYDYAKLPDTEFQSIAAGGILILLGLLLSMNAVAIFLRNRYARR